MSDLNTLLEIMAKLRDRQTGCPWDKEQTFASIAPYTIEEVYEVVDAIERENWDELRDELGDLFFQVVYHSQMAKEAGYFDFSQVLRSLCDKLIRRHPHVFNDSNSGALNSDAQEQKKRWEQLKIKERQNRDAHSLMDDIPLAQPAMERALKIQKRAALAGFDWGEPVPVLDKIIEEVEELRLEIREQNQPNMTAELGDVLFAVINLARHLKIDPATALRQTNHKFMRRFRAIETAADKAGLASLTLAEMENLWQQVKQDEKASGESL